MACQLRKTVDRGRVVPRLLQAIQGALSEIPGLRDRFGFGTIAREKADASRLGRVPREQNSAESGDQIR
jgi:hypothetical protein